MHSKTLKCVNLFIQYMYKYKSKVHVWKTHIILYLSISLILPLIVFNGTFIWCIY